MTLYFETKVTFPDEDSISTVFDWHLQEPVFAVASYSQDKGGSVTVFSGDTGLPVSDVNFPLNPVSQATALRWHPERKLLMVGWENGDLFVYYDGRRDFALVKGPHKRSPIILVEFSEKGGRLVTADAMGVLTGWRCDSQGQLLTMFTHDLKESLLHITFRKTVESAINAELTNLAKAAVAGDETALDTLTTWRPRTAARNLSHSGVKDNHCFYVGTQAGILYYINQGGICTETYRSDTSPIIQILWRPKRETIVTLMDDMTVGHFLVEPNGSITELDRVKFSSSGRTPGHNGSILWVISDTLAIITGDFSVRIWNIDSSESFTLNTTLADENGLPGIKGQSNISEVFSCIAFCRNSQTLCAGTNQGKLLTWRRVTSFNPETPEDEYQLTAITTLRGVVKGCTWGVCEALKPCIFVNCISVCFILKEQPLVSRHSSEVWALQKSANLVHVEHRDGAKQELLSDVAVVEMCLSRSMLALTNGRAIHTYKISLDNLDEKRLSITQSTTFSIETCIQMFVFDQSLMLLTNDQAQVVSTSGVVLQDLFFTDIEGKPIGMDLTAHFLTVFSMNGFIKVYDVSRHEPKLVTSPRSAYDLFEHFGEIILAKSNIVGSHVVITIANENLVPISKIYVWHLETDKVLEFDFPDGPQFPLAFEWDNLDPRLFACETKLVARSKAANSLIKRPATSQVHVMFALDGKEIGQLESFDLAPGEKFIDFITPHIVLLKISKFEHATLRNFKEIEDCDDAMKKNVLDFSLNVALGKMDEAFSCIRSIKSNAVWINLAKMCVNTGRLDVAKVCLGHLKRATSVRALRRAMEDSSLEPEAKTAVLAIELGMVETAKELYVKCNRYDLLNRLCQACGHFEEALEIAEKHDRVHLKNTFYKYAEWLKETGDVAGALKYFEKSSNPTHNVTQMLLGDPVALKKYMQSTTDPDMLKWWAQYVESTGDMDSALRSYQKANDFLSQVRIYCFLGQLSKAESVASQSNDNAACYHLARHYESIDRFHEAIQLYTRAQSFSNAVRICKENDLKEELWTVAISARKTDQASAAAYFEEFGDFAKAVELYHRAGMLHKAVEMAFSSQQPEVLQVIASELTKDSDLELVERCAEFFLSSNQNHKAVMLLVNSRNLEKALFVCSEKGVAITETLSELMTPTKEEYSEAKRQEILTQMGEILQQQGDYQMATKKFTQAGDKIKAMKCLVKSGDTDKIIYFANMSRQKECYIIAANYLQGLDWPNNPKVLKTIVTFYTKAQSFDLLANFYANCAHIEILEFRDYGKAFKALQETSKCLAKIPGTARKIEELHELTNETRKVHEMHVLAENQEHDALIGACKTFLKQPESPPIKNAHVQALLIEALIHVKQYPDAMNYLRDLIEREREYRRWLDQALIEKLATESGVSFESLWRGPQKATYRDESNDIDEDIEETD